MQADLLMYGGRVLAMLLARWVCCLALWYCPTDTREARGLGIVAKGDQIKRTSGRRYLVKSQTVESESYEVAHTVSGWSCSCPDYRFRKVHCKHICAVKPPQVCAKEACTPAHETTVVNPIAGVPQCCVYCGFIRIIRRGHRYNLSGKVQLYGCKDCSRRFVFRPGFGRMRHAPETITAALHHHPMGLSCSKIAESLRHNGVAVHFTTVYRWVCKYYGIMKPYLEGLKVHVGGRWHGDEIYTRMSGMAMYFFTLMDGKTRFVLSHDIGHSKDNHNATDLLVAAKRRAGRVPRWFVTDGLQAYETAFGHAFAPKNPLHPDCEHIREIHLRDQKRNNNIEERLNGEIRDREKTFRGLKKADSPIIANIVLHHNYFRPHRGLGGSTPAEAAGIKINGQNKWLTVIGNAALGRNSAAA